MNTPGLHFSLSVLSLLSGGARTDDEFAPVQATLQACFACHGDRGAAPLPQNPILAGQEFYYLYVQLKDFKSGLRKSDVMGPIVQALQPDDLKLLAQYFSKQTWPGTTHAADPAKAPGVKAALDAGACISCHLGDFRGNSRVPRLAGQSLEYLTQTMLDFKSKARNNAPAMSSLMATFSEQRYRGPRGLSRLAHGVPELADGRDPVTRSSSTIEA
jgi:cytochrome c553